MKRFLFILATVMMAVSATAETTIQNTFMGLKLGKASQVEVQNVLTSKGFELQSDTGGYYVYQGYSQVEGVPIKNIVTRFLDDALIMMAFANTCENSCDSIKQIIEINVDKKYGLLQSGDSSVFIKLFSLGLLPLEMEQWSRMDSETSFMYAKADSGYVFLYLAESFIWEHLFSSFDENKKNSPDYAEENKVTGVAGVKFGDSRESVRRVISAKADDLLESDSHSLMFYRVKIGGSIYDYATFYFLPDKGLVSVNLSRVFQSWQEEEAKDFYESAVAQYKSKYTNLHQNKEEDYAFCGAYTDDYKDMPPIVISRKKSLSRGGEMKYYVDINYFLKRLSGLYNDEI